MPGKNLFEREAVEEVLGRIDKLNSQTPRQWGKMDVAQMLAHCANTMEMAMGIIKPKRSFIGFIIGPLFKSIYSNDKEFSKGTPTDRALYIVDKRDFAIERERLKNLINQFYNNGSQKVTTHPHPFFGHLPQEAWSRGMYKHLNHHLSQFGV